LKRSRRHQEREHHARYRHRACAIVQPGRRAFRRPDRRRRHLRRRWRLSPDQAVPRHQLCRAGDAGELRRDLDHPSLSRHPIRQRPLHLRLSLQAVDRQADRDRAGDPGLHGRGDRRERSCPSHPLSPSHRSRGLVGRRQSLDHRGRPARQRRAVPHHRGLPVDVPGLLSALGGLHAGMARHGRLQGPDRASPDLAQGPRRQGKEGRGHRLRCDRGHAGAQHRRQRRARHHAAALADLFHSGAQRQRSRRPAAQARGRRGVDPRDRAPPHPARPVGVHAPFV
jgi:hypothetical protein